MTDQHNSDAGTTPATPATTPAAPATTPAAAASSPATPATTPATPTVEDLTGAAPNPLADEIPDSEVFPWEPVEKELAAAQQEQTGLLQQRGEVERNVDRLSRRIAALTEKVRRLKPQLRVLERMTHERDVRLGRVPATPPRPAAPKGPAPIDVRTQHLNQQNRGLPHLPRG